MRNLYLIVAATFFLTACGGGSGGGSGGGAPSTDTLAPVVVAPASATFAAIDATGAPASSDAISAFLQGATASDNVDGSVSVSSDAPDDFPLGSTTVVFSATDAAGNKGTATAVVTVTDQTAPNLLVPEDESFVATSAAGIAVTNAALVDLLAKASASDNVDTVVTISNNAPAIFPIGETPVEFTATDLAGNKADRVTLVTVTGAAQEGKGEKGPLFRATVFFDYDGDKELDANEPSTLTDINGDYKLEETSNAPEDYLVVLLMNEDTIDGITGESYANSGVTLEAIKDSKVITPMTTLYSIAVSDLDEGEELSVEAFSSAIGLPEGVDVNTYSAYAKDDEGDYIDVGTASQVEAISQSLMTTFEVIAESVVNISKTALKSDSGISRAQASAVALKSLANVVAATAADNTAGGGVAKSVDLTNVDDIAEVNAAVLESLNSDDADSLGALLETTAVAAGTEVDKAAAEVTGSVILSLSTNTIATVSNAFKDVDVASFGQVEASAVSRIKAQVVSEIAAAAEIVVAAVSEQQDANETVELVADDVDVSAVITLDNEESLNATVAQNVQAVEAYLLTTVAPVIESGENFVAAENQTSVGSVIAADTAGDVLSYSLSGADAGALTISSSGVISFVTAPDFETKTLYSATVTVTDSNDNSVSQIIAISITDANDDAPAITSPSSFTVDENQSVIGSVVATSASPGAVLTFSLIGGDAAALTISANGLLGFVEEPDFEDKASYSTTVVVGDGNNDTPDTQAAITVSIVNLNDSAPVITSVDQFTVQENSKSVGAITATDEDFSALTYELSGTDASAFKVSVLGSLSFKTAPNFEVKSNYSLIVTVSDGVNSASLPLTVIVKDTDDVSPEFESGALFTAAENQIVIGTVEATDTDTDDNLIVFSVSGNDLAITAEGVLSFVALPDFEANASYTATVTATDGTNQRSQTITVAVTDVDDVAPVFTSLATFDVVENEPAIGTVTATDADSDNGSIIFSVSGDVLAITDDGVLSFVAAPDYEVQASYTATITAADGTNSTEQIITVTVSNVDDEAPNFTSAAAFTAAENKTAIGSVTAQDADSASVVFSISSDDLAITPEGVLRFLAAPDYETNSFFTATVTATDGTNPSFQTITVEVTDVDDVAPEFTSSASFSAEENQNLVGTVIVTDTDSVIDSISFSVSGDDLAITAEGLLSFKTAPDFEVKASYTATVTATDGVNQSSQTITITVSDVDDVAPVFTSNDSFSVVENQTAIGSAVATDADTDNASITFSISGDVFAITDAGVLSFVSAPDYELQASYAATITATDGTNSATQEITVAVTDLDDEAPVFTSSASFSAVENQTAIGTVAVTDADSASTTLSISGDDLAITSAGVLSFVAAPDYEANASYVAVVTATDGVNQASQTISIVVSDIDDEAPTFTSSYAFTVVENQMAIGTVTATDVDSDNGTITFSISGNTLAISDAGVLSFSAAPDFESNASYTATVTATDGANERSRVITVTVTDIDDEAPVFTSSASFTAVENQTAIGTVTATDIDSDDAAISFSVSGDDLEVTSAGVLSFASAPDYETNPSYSATITATDGSNQSEQIVTVAVTDVNDEAPVITSSATFNALDSQAVLGTVVATDADSASITFSISGSELAITSAGVISLAAGVDPAVDTVYTAIVTASDGLNLATQVISVAVLLDLDGDGEANVTDTDDDGDGILDVNDEYPLIATSYAVKAPLYLARAYHDCNGNESFDEATEPFALTETDGSYHINGSCGAITSFNTVIEMTAETIDYESGESYGSTAVQLKTAYSASGSKVNTPLTTLLKHIEQFEGDSNDPDKVAIEGISTAQLSLALGLPGEVDLLTFNPYASGVDPQLAHDVETISQKIMLVTVVVTEAIEGAGASASGASVTDDIAHEAILDAMSKVVIETIKIQEGNESNHIGHISPPDATLTGEAKIAAQRELKLNLADREHLEELFEFLIEDAKEGHLREALEAIGAEIPAVVLAAITDKTSEIISNIALEFDSHGESDFGSSETHITSHLKHDASEEIFAFAKGYRAYYDETADDTFSGVQPSDFLTLDGPEGIASARTAILAEVELHAEDKIIDTDNDGILNVLDLDDDNDGVPDTTDAFPRDANESVDSDSDGVGDNADIFALSDTAVTLTDYYPLDGSTVTKTLAYSVAGNKINVDLRAAPLNLTNISNAILGGDFNSPELRFGLSTLPTGSGTDTITIDLIDGVDGVIDAGERQVKVDIAVEWESDGTTASITVPTQTINASYKTGAGVQIDVQVANVDADVLTVTNNGVAYPATLEVKLFSLISQLSALPLADILSAGIYHVDVSTSLPLKAATGETLGGVSAIVEIVDAFKLGDTTITLQDINPSDGSVTSSVHEATVIDGFLSVDMRDAPLSLLNIEKGLYGLDFTSPKVLFGLSAIPSGTGQETVTINLIDGTDAVRSAGERQITVALEIEWDADGNAAAITVPAQDLTAYYLTGDGVRFDVALANADLDVLSVTSAGADYPASLELKLLSLITKLSGLPLSDLLSAGEFHLDVTTSMPLIGPAGLAVEGLKAAIEIQDDVVPALAFELW